MSNLVIFNEENWFLKNLQISRDNLVDYRDFLSQTRPTDEEESVALEQQLKELSENINYLEILLQDNGWDPEKNKGLRLW